MLAVPLLGRILWARRGGTRVKYSIGGWEHGMSEDDIRNAITPVPPEQVPTDLVACSLCGQPVPMVCIVDVEHDCSTGETTPI